MSTGRNQANKEFQDIHIIRQVLLFRTLRKSINEFLSINSGGARKEVGARLDVEKITNALIDAGTFNAQSGRCYTTSSIDSSKPLWNAIDAIDTGSDLFIDRRMLLQVIEARKLFIFKDIYPEQYREYGA